MSALAWLADVCDATRPHIGAPMTLDVDGVPHAVATNGHILVAVRGEHGFPPATAEQAAMMARVLVAPEAAPMPFSLPAFKDFLGVPEAPAAPCATCSDTGRVPCDKCDGEGERECECMDCGDLHEVICRTCDGTGDKRCPECRGERGTNADPISLFGQAVNRRLLCPVFRHLDGATATFAQDSRALYTPPAWLRGDGWTVLVMPLREYPTTALPTFDARERAA